MLEILWNIASFILALGVLVTIHEYGHFWVARRCGVKVLRFSVGFGKPIWSRMGKDGTEYVIAAIPLGGYVKMLDEREGEVTPEEKGQAFNNKPVLQRIAIVAAGPVANFLLAILVYWWMFVLGVPSLKPVLGEIDPSSIAGRAGLIQGLEIRQIDEQSVGNWQEVNLAVIRRMGEDSKMRIEAYDDETGRSDVYQLELKGWVVDPERPDALSTLGIRPWQPYFPAELGEVLPEGAAAASGLQANDKIIRIDGQEIADWQSLVRLVSASPDASKTFEIERMGQQLSIPVQIGSREQDGQKQGYLGVSSPQLPEAQRKQIESMRYRQQYGFVDGIGKGLEKTWDMTVLSFELMAKIFTGDVSPRNLSGPITIAQGAGAYASYGFVFFLGFLGMISVNLGIINLLPIPVLDGGHLMYYSFELVTGQPLSEKVQEMGYRVGMLLVLSLMVFSVLNDLSRL